MSPSAKNNALFNKRVFFNALVFSKNGEIADSIGTQHQASFLLAIRELNHKSDGVYDDLLPNTEIKFAVRHASDSTTAVLATDSLLRADVGAGKISAVVNGFAALNEGGVSAIINRHSALQLDTLFGDYSDNDIFLRPSPELQGNVIQDLLCDLGYKNVLLIGTAGPYTSALRGGIEDGSKCNFTSLATVLIPSAPMSSYDLLRIFDDTKARDQRINGIVICSQAGMVIKTLYELGVIRLGTQVIISEEAVSGGVWQNMQGESPSDVSSALRGALGVRYDGLSHFKTRAAAGSDFLFRWRAQPPTVKIAAVCNGDMDDSTESYFLNSDESASVCAGLNFSTFSSIYDLDTGMPIAYDAVLTIAVAAHHNLEVLGVALPTDAEEWKEAIIAGLSWFSGKTGTIVYNYNIFSVSLFLICIGLSGGLQLSTNGDRRAAVSFTVFGFTDEYRTDDADISMAEIDHMYWSFDDRALTDCTVGVDFNCRARVYNSQDGLPPNPDGPYSDASLPNIFKVAGIFKVFNADGTVDRSQAQHLASFLMAIREINDKGDGIDDDLLPDTKLVATIIVPDYSIYGIEKAVDVAENIVFGGKGILSCYLIITLYLR